jgi:hypothetical protein
VAPGAVAAQREFGVPAAVTIAQAILESGWGSSTLASQDHNLFGIKGTGPAGSVLEPTQEYVNGRPVARTASFRVYYNFAQSIEDHGRLLADSGYYGQAMAVRSDPDAFANALTGVYATDPYYGSQLIGLMQQYDLYRYDVQATAAPAPAQAQPKAARPTAAQPGATQPRATQPREEPARRRVPRRRVAQDVVGAAGASIPGLPAEPAAPAPAPAPASAPAKTAPARTTPARTTSVRPERTPPTRTVLTDYAVPASPAPVAEPRAQPHAQARAEARAEAEAEPRAEPHVQARAQPHAQAHATDTATPRRTRPSADRPRRPAPARAARKSTARYRPDLPLPVRNAFNTMAFVPLRAKESLYKDVAGQGGIGWELLAACDWMQCRAQDRYSPVHGEKLGTLNADGTIYRTKSEALERATEDLIDLGWAVYRIDLTRPEPLSVRELANVFAAFRWGGLLKLHHTSAMEFPYSVAGLTAALTGMRWPNIDDPNVPDKPGARFRMPFGAVPVVLSLKYPATD